MPAERAQLLELAERVEKASGPDRELDAEIALTIIGRWHQADRRNDGSLRWSEDGRELLFYAPPLPWSDSWVPVPRFTSSLDAALTLVPERAPMTMGRAQTSKTRPWVRIGKPEHGADVVADTLPLALCAASLRALAAQPQEEGSSDA